MLISVYFTQSIVLIKVRLVLGEKKNQYKQQQFDCKVIMANSAMIENKSSRNKIKTSNHIDLLSYSHR